MSQTNEPSEPVATGDRRDEVHFERRGNAQLRVRATVPPDAPLPRELTPQADREGAPAPDQAIDVAVLPEAPSAWDARPPDD
jgi:hypothetical protein